MIDIDIMRMAKEAGGDDWGIFKDFMPEIEHFAELVAAAEREKCAKVCDDLPVPPYVSNNDAHIWDLTCVDCANAIRERGQHD
jgi:hypothetical protein